MWKKCWCCFDDVVEAISTDEIYDDDDDDDDHDHNHFNNDNEEEGDTDIPG